MIRDLINIELNSLPLEGLDVHIIKRYVVKASEYESFQSKNYSLILIKSGQYKIRISEITLELTAHDLVVIPKKSFCKVLEVTDELQLFIILFTSEFVFQNFLKKELVDSFHFLQGESATRIALEERDFLVLSPMYKLIYHVNKDARQNSHDEELKRISFNLFLYALKFVFNRYAPEVRASFSRQENLTIQFLTILTIHCKKQHGVKFYAGALFVTPGYLNKVIKQVTGRKVKNLIDQAIINEIKNYLENSQSNIAAIAEDFEFSNLSSFSAFFRKHTSIPPTKYRFNVVGRFKSL